MKKISLIILLGVSTALTFSSFKTTIVETSQYRRIEEVEYDTINFESTIISGVKLGGPYGALLEKLGSPDSVRKEETPDAQNSDHFEIYLYGKDSFYVMDEMVSGFELKSTKFQLDNLGGLKVGDPIAKVKKIFPKSYKIRDIDEFNPSWITISVQFGSSDSFLEIYCENSKVKSITTVTDDEEEEE